MRDLISERGNDRPPPSNGVVSPRHVGLIGGSHLSVSLFSQPNRPVNASRYRLGSELVVFCDLA